MPDLDAVPAAAADDEPAPEALVPVAVLFLPLAPALPLAPGVVAEPAALVVPAAAELLSPLLRTPPRTVFGFVLLGALAALVL